MSGRGGRGKGGRPLSAHGKRVKMFHELTERWDGLDGEAMLLSMNTDDLEAVEGIARRHGNVVGDRGDYHGEDLYVDIANGARSERRRRTG